MNKREAVELFVERDFNNIPLSLVERAYNSEDGLGLSEKVIQPVQPEPSDYELEDDTEPEFCYGEEPMPEDFVTNDGYLSAIEGFNSDREEFEDKHKRWEEYQSAYEQWESDCQDHYPMWGTLFECNDGFVADEIREKIKEVQDIGFVILDDFDELNLCLGVAGAGYDFYSAHWTPLYNLLGLRWHKEDSEE